MWDYLIKWLLLLVKSLPTNVHVRKINVHLFLVINVYTLYPPLTPASIPWYTINTVDPCILRSKWKWKRRTEDIFVISQCKVLGKMNGFLLNNYSYLKTRIQMKIRWCWFKRSIKCYDFFTGTRTSEYLKTI